MFHLSELSDGFRPHTSLDDKPNLFECQHAKGAIFYMPAEGNAGGDSFDIYSGDSFAVSLLCDMAGHGPEGRRKITPYRQHLEKIAATAAIGNLDDIYPIIRSLDTQTPFSHEIALTLARISPTGQFLNLGENLLYVVRNENAEEISNRLIGGKVGWLKLTDKENNLGSGRMMYQQQFRSGDAIVLCSDGIRDYEAKSDNVKKDILPLLHGSEEPEHIVKIINSFLKNQKLKRGIIPEDDYTLIALKVK